jgi:hypothetical protein
MGHEQRPDMDLSRLRAGASAGIASAASSHFSRFFSPASKISPAEEEELTSFMALAIMDGTA